MSKLALISIQPHLQSHWPFGSKPYSAPPQNSHNALQAFLSLCEPHHFTMLCLCACVFLNCGWFTLLCYFLLYKVIRLYTHTHTYIYIYIYIFKKIFFSIMVYHRIVNIVPYTYKKTLLFIHPLYNSLHLLTPSPQSIPPQPPPPSWLPQVFSLSVILFVFHR